MRHINKILVYFNSSYTNSTRYNHSTSSWLKIIFERNNKYKSSLSNLGNVFRNSKWTDFKVQNIKESLIKDWVLVSTGIFIFIFVYCTLLGLWRGDSVIRYIPFIDWLIEVITELWVPFTNYIDYLIVCTGSYYFYLIFKVRSRFFNNQNIFLNEVLLKPKTLTTTSINEFNNNQQNLNIKSVYVNNTSKVDINKALNLVNSTLSFSSLSTEDINININSSYTTSFIKDTHTKVWFITLQNSKNIANNAISFKCNELAYVLIGNNTDLKLVLNPYSTSQIQKNIQLIPNNLNIVNQLSLAKQDRWFLKNSILSDSLIKSTANFTSSKKLITSELLTSKPSNNVWLSSKIGNLSSVEAHKFAQILNKINTSLSNSTVNLQLHNLNNSEINFFEDSRLFFTKRFFFSNELKNNFWESQNILSKNQTNNTLVIDYIPSLYVKSLLFNTNNLISLPIVNTLSIQSDSQYPVNLDLSLASNTMLHSSNINFINNISTVSSNSNKNIKISKTSPLQLIFLNLNKGNNIFNKLVYNLFV